MDEGKFDFIHSRMLNGGIKAEQWDGYVEDIFRILKPGGWVQMAETNMITWDDDSVPEGSAYLKVHPMWSWLCGFLFGGCVADAV